LNPKKNPKGGRYKMTDLIVTSAKTRSSGPA
jgi:hypothetical protein